MLGVRTEAAIKRHEKITGEVIARYKLFRALWMAYYNRLDTNPTDLAHEYFYVVGEVFEGKPLSQCRMTYVKPENVYELMREEKA